MTRSIRWPGQVSAIWKALSCAATAGVFVIALAWPGVIHANCGAAFCSLSTDWAGQGVWTDQGIRLDVRYELVTQDTLRKGTREVDYDAEEAEDEGFHHLEKKTVNRNLLVTLDYAFDPQSAIAITVPYVEREHEHLLLGDHGDAHAVSGPRFHGEASDEPATQKWSFQELGDVRVVGRHLFSGDGDFLDVPRTYGVEFGLKLPTGTTDVENGRGEEAERPLQPGTGTTDVILGAFLSQQFAGGDSSAFAKLALQEALAQSEGYAPGTRLSLDLGYRFQVGELVGLMAQLNLLWKDQDSGDEAEPEDSGGTFVFLSPGVAAGLGADVQVYGFYQLPLYQSVNGVQLTADDGIVLGVGARF